MKMLPAGV